jgi:carboxymethylenebutenolidase
VRAARRRARAPSSSPAPSSLRSARPLSRAHPPPIPPPKGWYATDLHTAALSKTGDDSLARAGEVQGRLLMLWGTADPHVPLAGRRKIYDAFTEAGVKFEWHEFAGAHAFLRDENSFGRFDPVLALQTYGMAVEFLHRWLR